MAALHDSAGFGDCKVVALHDSAGFADCKMALDDSLVRGELLITLQAASASILQAAMGGKLMRRVCARLTALVYRYADKQKVTRMIEAAAASLQGCIMGRQTRSRVEQETMNYNSNCSLPTNPVHNPKPKAKPKPKLSCLVWL